MFINQQFRKIELCQNDWTENLWKKSHAVILFFIKKSRKIAAVRCWFFKKEYCAEFLASYSRSLREKGLVDSAMDDLDFEQDFGKEKSSVGPKTTGEGSSSKKKSKKGLLYNTGMII